MSTLVIVKGKRLLNILRKNVRGLGFHLSLDAMRCDLPIRKRTIQTLKSLLLDLVVSR